MPSAHPSTSIGGFASTMERRTRSGTTFAAFSQELIDLKTRVSIEPLLEQALAAEWVRFLNDEGDNEGLPLSPESTLADRPTRAPPRRYTPPCSPPAPLTDSHRLPPATLAAPSEKNGTCTEASRNKARSKIRRKAKQKAKASDPLMPAVDYRPRSTPTLKKTGISSLPTDLDSTSLPAASGRWVGKRIKAIKPTPWTLDELRAEGLKPFPWDGCTPHVLTDNASRGTVILAGTPSDLSWLAVAAAAEEAMTSARLQGEASGTFTCGQTEHRRGCFVALACGVSHGGGQTKPQNLAHPPQTRKILDSLLNDPNIQRIAGFQSSAFAYYAPKLYKNYASSIEQLWLHEPGLDVNFPDSIFPATTFNLGPHTVTLDHTDPGNVAYGMCALTAGGNYDPKKGGHLVLFDLGWVIEFPPGSTILLPSSILRHGNCPIQDGERRVSISQYCAGGLFRWVKYGFQTARSLESKKGGKALKRKLDGDDAGRTMEALNLFSTIANLDRDRREVFHPSTPTS